MEKKQSSRQLFAAARSNCYVLFVIIIVTSAVLMVGDVISANSGFIAIAIGFLLYVVGDILKAVGKLLEERDGKI